MRHGLGHHSSQGGGGIAAAGGRPADAVIGVRRSPSLASWAEAAPRFCPEVCDADLHVQSMQGCSPTPPSSRASLILQSKRTDVETLKEKARLEQELESDRRFFADPPEDYVRCPACHVIYAVQGSRPATPTDLSSTQPSLIPASYSKELPRIANLTLEEATRHMHRSRFRCASCDMDFCRCGVAPYHWGWSCDGWNKHQQATEQVGPAASCRWCLMPCVAKKSRSDHALAPACCGSDEGTDLKKFPPTLSCVEKERRGCLKRHSDCGHWCGGIRGEESCLPCLHPDCVNKRASARPAASSTSPVVVAAGAPAPAQAAAAGPLPALPAAGHQLGPAPPPPGANFNAANAKLPCGDEWCPICWTEPLNAAPAVRLACGHVLHQHCVESMVRKGNTGGRRLTFKNIRCPLCSGIISHPSLDTLVAPQYDMYQKVWRKALQRWVVEQRSPSPRPNDPTDEDRIATLAMAKMSFFECSQCREPYYGGEVECGGAEDVAEDIDDDVQVALAMELICRGCASKGQLQCPEHGTEFLGWKCRYCCEREAHYFCFGTTHFCCVCHDIWQTGVDQRRKLQAGKPCLGKDRCIFGGKHPPGCRNGRDEYALGCTVCAQDTECGVLVNRELRRASRKRFVSGKNCCVM